MRSPTARLVWRHVAEAWCAFCPGDSWAASAAQDGRPSDDACRAILLGLRPDAERALREPFALLRGLAVHEIVRHRHAVWLSASRDGPDMTYDHVRAAARIYARVRATLADAVAQERKRCLLLQRQMRAAGLPASSCFGPHSPMAGWRATWEDTGVCTVQGDVVTQQLLLAQTYISGNLLRNMPRRSGERNFPKHRPAGSCRLAQTLRPLRASENFETLGARKPKSLKNHALRAPRRPP